MKNRILIVLAFVSILLLTIQKVNAQVTSSGENFYVFLSSYQGVTLNRAYGFMLHIRGYETKYEGWSLAVRANPDIINNEGKVMDPAKISLRMNTIEGERFPTMAQIGANKTSIPLDYSNRFFTQNSPYAIQQVNGKDYAQWSFFFDLIIAGGAYLEKLQSYKEYILNTTFSVLDRNNQVVTQLTIPIRMMIYPQGAPPSGPVFGFEVKADASLNFNVPEDYTRKVESSEESWLKVSSKTSNYVVKVHTSNPYFEGQSDIPVGIVSMQVEDKKGSRTGPGVSLEKSDQTVFTGNATGSETCKLDVRYFISPDNAKGLATYRPGAYTTRLTYTLLPQ